MTAPEVPVNRALVGILALGCVAIGGIWWIFEGSGNVGVWPGSFLRVGLIMGAFWLALPTRTREAAWARISLWNLIGGLLALLLVVRAKLPLRLLLPGVLVLAAAIYVLRPRPKTRPRR
jgi:hypothetical protein